MWSRHGSFFLPLYRQFHTHRLDRIALFLLMQAVFFSVSPLKSLNVSTSQQCHIIGPGLRRDASWHMYTRRLPPQIRWRKYIFNNDIKPSDSWTHLLDPEKMLLLWAGIRVPWLLNYIISLSNVKQNYSRIPHSTSQKCAWLEMRCGAVLSSLIICCTNFQVRRVGKRFEFLIAAKIIESPPRLSVALSLCYTHSIPSPLWLR